MPQYDWAQMTQEQKSPDEKLTIARLSITWAELQE